VTAKAGASPGGSGKEAKSEFPGNVMPVMPPYPVHLCNDFGQMFENGRKGPRNFLNRGTVSDAMPSKSPSATSERRPHPRILSERKPSATNDVFSKNPDEIKHGKTCHHWATPGRVCVKGSKCKFLHAWVDPEKVGVCRNHQLGHCFYSDKVCYFQHLHIPIWKYEELSQRCQNYYQLEPLVHEYCLRNKIGKHCYPAQKPKGARKLRTKRNQKGKGSTDVEISTFPKTVGYSVQIPKPFPIAVGSELQTERPQMAPQMTPGCHASDEKNITNKKFSPYHWTNNPFQRLDQNQSSTTALVGPGVKSHWRALNESNEYPELIDGFETLDIRKLASNTPKFQKKIENRCGPEIVSPETKTKSPTRDEVSSNITSASVNMKEWSCEEVYTFIRNFGKASCWGKYAEQMKEAMTDGATLIAYEDPKALVEDFNMIIGHARIISNKVKEAIREVRSSKNI